MRRFLNWLRPTRTREVTVIRLEQSVFDHLRSTLGGAGNTYVTKDTTELQAGFMLGVTHVLNAIQSGIVIPDARKN